MGRRNLLAHLSFVEILMGVGLALLIAWLLAGFQFQSIPDYELGAIADRDIKAPRDFTLIDEVATLQRQEEIRKEVPAVFYLNLIVNNRIEAELRSAFAEARRAIAQERETLRLSDNRDLPSAARQRVLVHLRGILPRFDRSRVLEICLVHSFSPELENQMVRLVRESLRHPGVVLTRDSLLRNQERGIILRDVITGQDEPLVDWMSIRDLGQARDLLRQNQFELTAVSGQDKREILDFLDNWIVPNLEYHEAETRDLEAMVIEQVDPVFIQIKKGRSLVRAGDAIEEREMALMDRLKSLGRPRRLVAQFVGILLIVMFYLFAIWQFFVASRKRQREFRSHYVLLALVLLLSLVLMKIFVALGDARDVIAGSLGMESLLEPMIFHFLAPLAIGSILIVLLVDVQISVVYSLVLAVFVGLMTAELSMFIYALTGSLSAIYLMGQYRERAALIKGGLLVGVVNVMTILSIMLYISEIGFNWGSFLVNASAGLLSGIFSAMLASLLLPILELLFEITTDIKLLELSNLDNPILRRLAVEAAGTYHHSILVGMFAEAGAEAVGANALLVRVGAYYHDIGKLKKPEYYVENQIYAWNKHDDLSPSMSSLILSNHVKDGLAIAQEIKLVREVRDLIPQHHGTRLMTYFYQKAKDAAGKDRKVNEEDFRYEGPKPQTKAAAILMLADQVEAAARTLQDPNPNQIRSMIRRLIQSTIQDRQFEECDITMRDLDKITRAFERVLSGMHHHRIPYPGFDFNRQVEEKQAGNQRIQ